MDDEFGVSAVPKSAEKREQPLIRVLLVEDQEFEAALTTEHLRGSGIAHVIHRVETEPEMRAALRDFNPTIILSDFTLPQFGGLSALEIARECNPDIPFIFVSGTIGEERAIDALRRGAIDYVLKSNLARLGPAVRRALEEADARRIRQRQEIQIARLTGVLRMLSGINSAVVRISDRNELFREACRLAVTVGGYATAIVALRVAKEGVPELAAWSGADHDVALRLRDVIGRRVTRDIGLGKLTPKAPTELVFSEKEYGPQPPVAAEVSAAEDGVTPPDRPMIALPLAVDKTVIGVLAVCSRQPGSVGDEEMRMLHEVAANISFALQFLRQDRKVRLLSYFDVLTGLAKRTLFCQRLGRLLESPDGATRCAVAVLDIQNLSAVNDSFGRHSGDLLLQLLADRLRHQFQDTELLAHLGGGTFALIQPITTAQQALEPLNRQLEVAFAEAFALNGKDVPIVARAGVAICPEDGHDPETLVQRAEAALRTAKAGGERSRHYSAEQHSAALARVALERKLRVALERDQFELHYQPKVNVKSRRIEGAEALIRWNDPDVGLVSPAEFLPILEASGLIVDVGYWVIERAVADCQRWRLQGLPPLRVAVNVSPIQLNEMGFVERLLSLAQGATCQDCGIDVEITESALLDESAAAISKLRMLNTAGINVAIDDFGTGYSSLARLDNLPIDTLKIDRSFVSRMTATRRGRKLVSIIISIARAFKMTVVAEGVETHEQLEALLHLGCDQSQGYLHSRPVTNVQFAELVRHGRDRYLLPMQPGTGPEQARADTFAESG